MRQWAALVLGLLLAIQGTSAAFVMNEVPDFSDEKQWSLVETTPLASRIHGTVYVWGTIKKYRLRGNQSIVGYEEYAYRSPQPYFKTWGRETERPFYALKESDPGPWLVGPQGSWWELRFDLDPGGRIKGVWVVLFVQSITRASGRYLADPAYQAPPSTPKEKMHI